MGKISSKLIKTFQRKKIRKIINLNEIQFAKNRLKDIDENIKNRLDKAGSDPSFKIYILMQNFLSYFAEEVSTEDEFTDYYDKAVEVEDEYMPSYPPMSPLTGAYHVYSSFCDVQFGESKETICTIFYYLLSELDIDKVILNALEKLGDSYMGIYKHEGFEDDLIVLKEINSGKIHKCICTSGYKGKKNETWFVRLVPNLDEIYDYYITLTTPYVILKYGERDWANFYKRQNISDEKSYYNFMKNNSDFKYWHDYIMDAYVNFRPNYISLTGIPDIKGSKPHEL